MLAPLSTCPERCVSALLRAAEQVLAGVSATPRLDAELLLAWAVGRSRSAFYAWPEQVPPEPQRQRFAQAVARRYRGEPLAYITGRRAFWSFELDVSPATLIPRPETELVVELALARMPSGQTLTVADLGTGSGAIALALARERPQATVLALDVSAAALIVARANAVRLKLANVHFAASDWCAALKPGAGFDLIVANPPYIAADSPYLDALAYEPPQALVSGHDGLDALRAIIAQAPAQLVPGGWLLLEHGYDQAAQVCGLLRRNGFDNVTDTADLAGHGRVCAGRWSGSPAVCLLP